ncbi:MAG TPA: fatty acid--CoA ligase family protein [Candidatus Udaeobacter sp.]|jgi:acyl-coenzyme A synthetase/AMP-(fatty) acid ligase|nr:fatty acid--CoA ligase family protein [Candidatus Udaeobacter sp.]
MKSSDPLLEAWEETLVRKGDAPAIYASSGKVISTFFDIERHALAAEAKMPASKPFGINPIQIGNHSDWPSLFLACLRMQRVVLPIDDSISKHQAEAIFSIAARSGTTDWGANPPTLFKLTSGTTATPRLVRFRSEQLLADCNQICHTMGIHDTDLNFGVIPISHSYGFSNLLTPLIVRGVPMVITNDRTPRAILADLARSRATVFPGMPVFYQAFCEMENIPVLPNLRLCISAGAPLPIGVAKKFQEKFQLPIHSFYGSSECGGICYDREAINPSEGSVGEAMKGVRVEMIDPSGSPTQIRVRSAAAGDGYFPEPDEEKLGNGIFIPDDLLIRDGPGFRIVGRTSDVINVAGKKVNPAEVESHLLRFTGVRQAVVFGRPAGAGALRNEEVAACVVAAPGISETDLLRFCRSSLSTWQVPKQIFIVDRIPANERGKISRRDLSQRFSTRRARSTLS